MTASLSRRRFLATTAAWAGGSSFAFPATADTKTISILHTTDLHGHIMPTKTYSGLPDVGGFARCATRIRNWRKQNPDSLLVDVGDLYQGTAVSYENEGRLFVDLLADFGYDSWTLGNHDFDWGPEVLLKNLAAAKTPVITGNLTGAPENVIPWKMQNVGGFKIALIGLVTPGLPYWLMPETLGDFQPTDPALSLKKSIAQAKSAKADAIVVLGHFGQLKEDDFANPLRETLKAAPGADVFIAGHTHKNIPSETIEGVLYTQAGYFGINCGKVDLTFDVNSRKLIAATAGTDYMDASVELDPGVIQLSQPQLRNSDEHLARQIAVLNEPMLGKKRDSPLARFLCESILKAVTKKKLQVDAVFHGTFGTPLLPEGPVTIADTWEILPYENTLVVAEITPKQMLEILDEDRATYGSDRILYPLTVIYEKKAATDILRDGKPIDPDIPLTVVFNSYDSQSGGQRLMKLREIIHSEAAKRQPLNINTRDALIDHFLNT
ncbi:MAG: bifunctional UDP-sugar hydrolase/5'-nucleotidase [Luteolibacter sp.]